MVFINSRTSNFFTQSAVVPREQHFHGWAGSITVTNAVGNNTHAEIIFTIEGVGCATLAKGEAHTFAINENNNNAATQFLVNYTLVNAEWSEVPNNLTLTNATTTSSLGIEPYGCVVVVPDPRERTAQVSMGSRVESVTAVLEMQELGFDGAAIFSGTLDTNVHAADSVKGLRAQRYLDGLAARSSARLAASIETDIIQGVAPLLLAGVDQPVSDNDVSPELVKMTVSSQSLEQVSMDGTRVDHEFSEAIKWHYNQAFPVYRGLNGFKDFATFRSITQDASGERGGSLLLVYTVHERARYEAVFRQPLNDLLKNGQGYVLIDSDVQSSVHLPITGDQSLVWAKESMPHLDQRTSGKHHLAMCFPLGTQATFWTSMASLFIKLQTCATLKFAYSLQGKPALAHYDGLGDGANFDAVAPSAVPRVFPTAIPYTMITSAIDGYQLYPYRLGSAANYWFKSLPFDTFMAGTYVVRYSENCPLHSFLQMVIYGTVATPPAMIASGSVDGGMILSDPGVQAMQMQALAPMYAAEISLGLSIIQNMSTYTLIYGWPGPNGPGPNGVDPSAATIAHAATLADFQTIKDEWINTKFAATYQALIDAKTAVEAVGLASGFGTATFGGETVTLWDWYAYLWTVHTSAVAQLLGLYVTPADPTNPMAWDTASPIPLAGGTTFQAVRTAQLAKTGAHWGSIFVDAVDFVKTAAGLPV